MRDCYARRDDDCLFHNKGRQSGPVHSTPLRSDLIHLAYLAGMTMVDVLTTMWRRLTRSELQAPSDQPTKKSRGARVVARYSALNPSTMTTVYREMHMTRSMANAGSVGPVMRKCQVR